MPKQVDHEERRRELAAAVRRVVGAGGLESLTVRAIAKEAGWSTGVLTHYFENRADLLLAAFRYVYQNAWDRIQGRLDEHDDPVEGVIAALGEAVPLTGTLRTDTTVWFAFVGLAVGDPDLREVGRTGYDRWTAHFGEAIRAAHPGAITEAEGRRIARRLTALVDGLTVQALFDSKALPAKVLQQEIRLAVDREFSAPPAAPPAGRGKVASANGRPVRRATVRPTGS
jgi:AcrR family transcriptional regulator